MNCLYGLSPQFVTPTTGGGCGVATTGSAGGGAVGVGAGFATGALTTATLASSRFVKEPVCAFAWG